ncbi:hypothetical protein HRbin30_02804 [bacterium HR30]|nr:hypothetical protein HRbin30_02804 [bacterium HR30]
MSQSNSRALVLFPGALGDFLLFLPTLFGLANRHARILLVARSEWTALLDHPRIRCWPLDHPAVIALFSESFHASHWREPLDGVEQVYSWTGHTVEHFSTNLAKLIGREPAVFPFRAFRPKEHAAEYYARCAGISPAKPAEIVPYLRAHPSPLMERLQADRTPLLAVHPGSGATRKNWQGFSSLVARWKRSTGGHVVVLLGPAEVERGVRVLSGDVELVGRPLPEVAAVLRSASCYVGNDSGVSHLAAILGTRGVVVMGPYSTPEHWRPLGNCLAIAYAAAPCGRCGPDVFCEHLIDSGHVLELLDRRNFSVQPEDA